MNSKVITRGLVRYKISPNQYPGDRALQAQRFFCRYVVGVGHCVSRPSARTLVQ